MLAKGFLYQKYDIKYFKFKSKMFFVKIFVYIANLLLKLAGQKKAHGLVYKFDQTTCTCYYETKIVKLKDLQWIYKNIKLDQVQDMYKKIKSRSTTPWMQFDTFLDYNWECFIEDLKTNGLKENIKVFKYKYEEGYFIYNGNHRAIALEYLHGKDYEVPIDIYITNEFFNKYSYNRKIETEKLKIYVKARNKILKSKTYD